jgi:hypothetical protein
MVLAPELFNRPSWTIFTTRAKFPGPTLPRRVNQLCQPIIVCLEVKHGTPSLTYEASFDSHNLFRPERTSRLVQPTDLLGRDIGGLHFPTTCISRKVSSLHLLPQRAAGGVPSNN